jgi:hypothetical protein
MRFFSPDKQTIFFKVIIVYRLPGSLLINGQQVERVPGQAIFIDLRSEN